MSRFVSPLDKLTPLIAEAIAEWHEANDPNAVKQAVHSLLNENKNKVVLSLLGFDSRYGQAWEVDHTNGRVDSSFAGKYLQQYQKQAIEEFFQSVYMPKLSTKELDNLNKKMHSTYIRTIEWQLERKVQARAEKDLDELLEKILTPVQTEMYAKLTNLISGENNG